MKRLFLVAAALCAALSPAASREYKIVADFRGDNPPSRVMRDIAFPCDLTDAEGLAFDFLVEDLSEFAYFSFHFNCAGEWVGSSGFVPEVDREWRRYVVKKPRDWTVRVDWSNVKAFRISGWRGGTNRTMIAVRNIAVAPRVVETKEERERRMEWYAESNRVALARLASMPAPKGERRLAWKHDPCGLKGKSWDESIEVLKKGGFTDILGNFLRGSRAAYKSRFVPLADVANGRDRLEECKAACRKHGVKLHVWNCCWRTGWGTTDEELAHLAAEGRLQVSDAGEVNKGWMCPSHPANRKLLVDTMLELAREKGVDGVHFDYIRYPDGRYCCCAGCKARFEAAYGVTVTNWPADVRAKGPLGRKWFAFRRDAITAPVAEVAEALHRSGSKVEVSAAVFRNPLADPDGMGQDWAAWCEKGYLDFVCPMTYQMSRVMFERQQRNHMAQVTPKVPRYPGIGLSVWEKDGLDVARFAEQVGFLRRSGIGGFTVFELSPRFEKLMDAVAPALDAAR